MSRKVKCKQIFRYLASSLTAILIEDPGNRTLSLRISNGSRFGRSLLGTTIVVRIMCVTNSEWVLRVSKTTENKVFTSLEPSFLSVKRTFWDTKFVLHHVLGRQSKMASCLRFFRLGFAGNVFLRLYNRTNPYVIKLVLISLVWNISTVVLYFSFCEAFGG